MDFPQCDQCTVRQHSVFCDLTTAQAAELSANKGCNQYKKGQHLFFEGARPFGVHCIYQGNVKLVKTGIDGKEQIVRLVRQGDILGYNAILSGEMYNVSAIALEEVMVCFIPKQNFLHLLEEVREFPKKMMQLMSSDMNDMENRLTNWLQKTVRERLAEVLLLLQSTYGTLPKSQALNIRLTREDLANLIGTAPETVIRYLAELKSENVIDLKGKEIIIKNKIKLVRIANIEWT
jgi:CRP/FNR family transcriptional regulator